MLPKIHAFQPAVSQNGFHCAPGSPPDKRNIRGIDYADQKLVASKPSTGDPLIEYAIIRLCCV